MSEVDKEIEILVAAIKKHGYEEDGVTKALFGKVFEETVDTLEALNGTLRSAKKKGIVYFEKQMLLQRVDDLVPITLCSRPVV
jgi:hypothetical protein